MTRRKFVKDDRVRVLPEFNKRVDPEIWGVTLTVVAAGRGFVDVSNEAGDWWRLMKSMIERVEK